MNENGDAPAAMTGLIDELGAQVELGFRVFAEILERDEKVLRGLGWDLTCTLASKARVAPEPAGLGELAHLRALVERQARMLSDERQAMKELQIALRDLVNEHAGAPF